MRDLAERAWFAACLALGRLLRGARYARTRLVDVRGEPRVWKRRSLHAPLLVWLSAPLLRVLDAGVRILPQRAWEERERLLYRTLYDATIDDERGALLLPRLPGETLATLLERPEVDAPTRRRAIEMTVAALVDLHARGLTHGDAMAENVLVDVDGGAARWFDFETVHEAARPLAWRRADDLRALLATCATRVAPARISETVRLVVDGYADDAVTRLVRAYFASALHRPLPFHLGQAPLSLERFRDIGRLL